MDQALPHKPKNAREAKNGNCEEGCAVEKVGITKEAGIVEEGAISNASGAGEEGCKELNLCGEARPS
jgi:hypothetical protein